MWNNQIFSLIVPTKVEIENISTTKNIIKNIIVCDNYEIANQIAITTYGRDAIAIDTTLYPVTIGDEYKGGLFYDTDGKVIERNLTEQEKIQSLQLELSIAKTELEAAKLNNAMALEAIASIYESTL